MPRRSATALNMWNGSVLQSTFHTGKAVPHTSRSQNPALTLKTLQVYQHASESCPKQFLVVIHVTADDAFHTYSTAASASDLALFRGQVLACSFVNSPLAGEPATAPAVPPSAELLSCSIAQAFLPKFHTRAQDKVDTAEGIKDQAAERFMMVSIKHSGSLAMISSDVASSKNSVGNAPAAAALVLLQAHYARLAQSRHAPSRSTQLRPVRYANPCCTRGRSHVPTRCKESMHMHRAHMPTDHEFPTAVARCRPLCVEQRISTSCSHPAAAANAPAAHTAASTHRQHSMQRPRRRLRQRRPGRADSSPGP